MARFRQADPDPGKAARDGVANYIPSRRQPNLNFTCSDCDRTATWQVQEDEKAFYACADHRAERAITARGIYRERRL